MTRSRQLKRGGDGGGKDTILPEKKIVKAYKLTRVSNKEEINYDINNPFGEILESGISVLLGHKFKIDLIGDHKCVNQFGTYLLADPITGFADNRFQSKLGTIILFSEDENELNIDFIDNLWDYFTSLMNYENYGDNGNNLQQYDCWEQMTTNIIFTKQNWDNFITKRKLENIFT